MTPERWGRIEELYHAAYAKPPAERAAFLTTACPDDDALRRQVEALLSQTQSGDAFFPQPALGMAQVISDGGLDYLIDRALGGYQIQTLVGAGGMGEVYRAHDPALGRDVAIKVLPREFTSDANRLARFEREARMLAALNHPNICGIYAVEEAEGIRFLVLELVEGETLAARLAARTIGGRNRGLPIEEALTLARQIAEALEAAHDKGVVHRDLKPANVKITPANIVKVLDFGLAKSVVSDGATPDLTHLPSAEPGEHRGGVFGTAGYMSPEQARGLPIDRRTDIWAFGVVLFEMITGRAPFTEETVSDTIAAILKTDPDWKLLPDGVSTDLRRLLRRCLEKEPHRRLQSIGDARVHIDELLSGAADWPETLATERPLTSHWFARPSVAWTVAAVATLIAAFVSSGNLGRRDAPRFSFPLLPPVGTSLATEESPIISPDGRRLAFVAYDDSGTPLLYTTMIGESAPARPLANTAGASLPFWSPDGESIGFFAQGYLRTVDVTTGGPRTLARAGGPRGGSWNKDGVIVFVPSPPAGPSRISAFGNGEDARPIPSPSGRSSGGWFPSFLPDGQYFLEFVPTTSQPENSGVWIVSLETGARSKLVDSQSNAIYAPPGYLLFWREGALWAQAFDVTARTMRGSPQQVEKAIGLNPVTNQALFSVSDSGTLAFFGGAVGESELVWLDRNGNRIGSSRARGVIDTISLSPDAASVVYGVADPSAATFDLWQLRFDGDVLEKLTFNPANDVFPLWSNDGSRIAFMSVRERPPQLYELPANGAGNETLLVRSKLPAVPSGWSHDGRVLFYTLTEPTTWTGDVWAMSIENRAPYSVITSPNDDRYATPSPDGRWLAYVSNESGTFEVYVQALPGPGFRRQVSSTGASQPQWSRDGKELFYMARNRTLMSVSFDSQPTAFVSSPPQPLFATRTKLLEIQGTARSYGVAPDGRRFLVANATQESQLAAITVVLNWLAASAR